MSKVMEEMLDFLGANPALLHGQPGIDGVPVVSEKKRKHKITEQKGRQKINDQINELKNLLPECRYVNTTKASILECGVNALKRLQALGNQLMVANKKLQRENKRLRTELEKYDPNAANSWDLNDNELETPDEVIPNLAIQNPLGSLNDILPGVDGVTSSPSMDPYLSPVDFTSMPSSSPPTSSPPIPSFYMPSPLDGSSDFSSSPYSDDYTANPMNYKISKRRLLLVVLLLIPFFLSFDSFVQAPSGVSDPAGTPRKLLFFNTVAPVQILSAIYYFDVARLAMYLVLGVLGVHWTANTVLWFKQMQPEFSLTKRGTC